MQIIWREVNKDTSSSSNPIEILPTCAMDKPGSASPDLPDFSEQWKLSDVVLVVEEQRFHAHRGLLAFWSPVFERMFTSDYKEKNSVKFHFQERKLVKLKSCCK